MNCWTPLLSGRWQRATRLASAWKTPPVTMDTTGDMPARHTHRSQYKLQFFFMNAYLNIKQNCDTYECFQKPCFAHLKVYTSILVG